MALVVIAGAGVSVPSGLPTFLELRDGLLKGIFPKHVGDIDARSFDDAPESVFYTAARRPAAREGVVDYVMRSLGGVLPNWNHEVLANVVEAGGTVWTPNFDTLIEQAASRQLRTISLGEPVPKDAVGHLLKPHGTLDSGRPPSEQQLIFTSDAIVQPPGVDWQAAFESTFADADVLIWGYRGADVDIMPLIIRNSSNANSLTWCSAVAIERESVRNRLPNAIVPDFGGQEQYKAVQKYIISNFLRPYGVPFPDQVEHKIAKRAYVEPNLTIRAPERANLAATLFSDAVARDFLLLGLLTERDRVEVAVRLARSLYYDQPTWRPFIRAQVRRVHSIPVVRHAHLANMLWLVTLDVDGACQSDAPALKRLLERSKVGTVDARQVARAWVLYNRVRASSLLRSLGHLRSVEEIDGDIRTGLYPVLVGNNAPIAANHLFNLAETARLIGDLQRSQAVIDFFYATWSDFAPHRWRLLMASSRAFAQLLAGDLNAAAETVEAAGAAAPYSRQSGPHADLAVTSALLELASQFLALRPPTRTLNVDLDASVASATRSARLLLVKAEHARVMGEIPAARVAFEKVLQSPSLYSRALGNVGLALCDVAPGRRVRIAANRLLRTSGGALWWMDSTGVIRRSFRIEAVLAGASKGPVLTLAVA